MQLVAQVAAGLVAQVAELELLVKVIGAVTATVAAGLAVLVVAVLVQLAIILAAVTTTLTEVLVGPDLIHLLQVLL